MWGSFLDKTKELAVKAQRAAEDLDKQLNESVGLQPAASAPVAVVVPAAAVAAPASDDDDDALNDAWEEDELDLLQDGEEEKEPAPTGASIIAASVFSMTDSHDKEPDAEPLPPPPREEQPPGARPEEPEGWDADDADFEEVDVNEKPSGTVEREKTAPPDGQQPTQRPEPGEPEPVAVEEDKPPTTSPEPAEELTPAIQQAEEEETKEAPKEEEDEEPSSEDVSTETVEEPPAEPVTSHRPVTTLPGDTRVEPVTPAFDEKRPAEPEETEVPQDAWAEEDIDITETANDEDHVSGPITEEPAHVKDDAAATSEDREKDFKTPRQNGSELTPEPPLFMTPAQPADTDVARFMEQQGERTRQMERQLEEQTELKRQMGQQIEELRMQLQQREEQLLSKTEQMAAMESMHEAEKEELVQKVQSTKEEAKRRIQKAKERVEAMEKHVQSIAASRSGSAEDAAKQSEIIAALREEGEKLARKQLEMEKAVRTAKGEARELREELEEVAAEKEKALKKIDSLQADLIFTKDELNSARRGESQAGKLDSELQQVREESEKRAATILSLEQEVKELKAEVKDLTGELEESRKGAVLQTEQQRKQMSREHSEAVSDLDNKMRQVEREAAIREDALRKEVDELRKRWQDAVRRADALSMDVQSSTAPLLRQLESANKQSRARSAAWAEMETQLRSELEETVISNEKLSKERSEWKTKYTRLERSSKEQESDLKQLKRSVEEKNARVKQLEEQVERMEKEGAKMKEEWAEVERLANEGVSRVRSEMTKTVVESEERYRTQLDSLESELRVEREKRSQLEEQVQTLLEKVVQTAESVPDIAVIEREAPPKKLRKSEGQIEILTGALNGLDNENDDEDDDDENDLPQEALQRSSSNFAALEELTSRLKAAKVELNTLRTRLEESESTRESLLADLAECRSAKEKLPLFEERVGELSAENQELSQEVQGLREDIVEVRELYRDQLNALLEEKTNAAAVNGSSTETASPEADTVRPTIDKGTAEDPSQAIAQESVQ